MASNSPTEEPLGSAEKPESKEKIYTLEEYLNMFMEKRNAGGTVLANGMTTRIQYGTEPAVLDDPSPEYVALKEKILELQEEGDKDDEIYRLLDQLEKHLRLRVVPFPRVQPLEQDDDVQEIVDLSNAKDPELINVDALEFPLATTVTVKQEESTSQSASDTITVDTNTRPSSNEEFTLHSGSSDNNSPGHVNQLNNAPGNIQQHGSHEEKVEAAKAYYENYLQPTGWAQESRNSTPYFIPATLRKYKTCNIYIYTLEAILDKGGKEGVHYAKDWEGLYNMVQKYGKFQEVPGQVASTLMSFNTDDIARFRKRDALSRQDQTGRYDGAPANVEFHVTIMKLFGRGCFKKNTKEYELSIEDKPSKENKKRYSQDDLLKLFVKNGIPNKDKLTEEERIELEELVEVANIDRKSLSKAREDRDGFSGNILDEESVQPLLVKFGFQPSKNELWYPPQGKENGMHPMTLDQMRVYIRENESWNAGGDESLTTGRSSNRIQIKTGDGDEYKLFSLRLWGATSPVPLPEYSLAIRSKWTCEVCRFENGSRRRRCLACEARRPVEGGVAKKKSSSDAAATGDHQSGRYQCAPAASKAQMTDITNNNVSSVSRTTSKKKNGKRKSEASGNRPSLQQQGADPANALKSRKKKKTSGASSSILAAQVANGSTAPAGLIFKQKREQIKSILEGSTREEKARLIASLVLDL